jgi:hypothetical protein
LARLGANSLGDLVGVVAVGLLKLLNELDVLLLSSLGGKLVLLDGLLPGVVLGLALNVVLVCRSWESRDAGREESLP